MSDLQEIIDECEAEEMGFADDVDVEILRDAVNYIQQLEAEREGKVMVDVDDLRRIHAMAAASISGFGRNYALAIDRVTTLLAAQEQDDEN
jgi:hypothetical protein